MGRFAQEVQQAFFIQVGRQVHRRIVSFQTASASDIFISLYSSSMPPIPSRNIDQEMDTSSTFGL
jgi:hypothetical protein